MTAKKKVNDEAGDTPVAVDEETVEAASADAPDEVAPESTPVESPVDEGDPVLRTAQGVLGVTETGVQNHVTKMALRKFQRENGLSPSGKLDDRTKAKLHI